MAQEMITGTTLVSPTEPLVALPKYVYALLNQWDQVSISFTCLKLLPLLLHKEPG